MALNNIVTEIQNGIKTQSSLKFTLIFVLFIFYQAILLGLILYAVIKVSLLTNQVKDLEELTNNLNTEISDRKLLQTKQNIINENFNNKFDDINQKLQKTTFVYVKTSEEIWRLKVAPQQLYIHPSCKIEQTFSNKSYVIVNIKGYFIHYNNPGCRVYILKDRKNPYFDDFNTFYQEIESKWIDIGLVSQFTVEPGTYIFEVGVVCYQNPEFSFNGVIMTMSFTNIL